MFQPLDMPTQVTVLPPRLAACLRGSVGTTQFMKEPGASAKPEPKARTPEPARSSAAMHRPNVPPPTLSELRWIRGSDSPDFHEGVRKLPEKDRSLAVGRTPRTTPRRFVCGVRGLHGSHEEAARSRCRRPKAADVKYGSKSRFEILASPDESLGLRFDRIRAIQGPWRMVLSNDTDLRTTHPLDGLAPRLHLSTRAYQGRFGFTHRDFNLVPKLGYHLTYRQCFASLLSNGLGSAVASSCLAA